LSTTEGFRPGSSVETTATEASRYSVIAIGLTAPIRPSASSTRSLATP
jgi:hypothetical protein